MPMVERLATINSRSSSPSGGPEGRSKGFLSPKGFFDAFMVGSFL